jgi:hypothetical protein
MAEALDTVYTCERGLLWGWWGPVGPKLVLDHMAAPVPEIMDTNSIKWYSNCQCTHKYGVSVERNDYSILTELFHSYIILWGDGTCGCWALLLPQNIYLIIFSNLCSLCWFIILHLKKVLSYKLCITRSPNHIACNTTALPTHPGPTQYRQLTVKEHDHHWDSQQDSD